MGILGEQGDCRGSALSLTQDRLLLRSDSTMRTSSLLSPRKAFTHMLF